MRPLSLLAAQTFLTKLTSGNALEQKITSTTAGLTIAVPAITAEQVLLSSAPPGLGDDNLALSYPRVCIYSSGLRNTQLEKFRSFSGQVAVVAEIWASDDLITNADQWIHFYVESVAEILQEAVGDWGNGLFYPGSYDVQFDPPKAGGIGFVESAKLSFNLEASLG